MHSTHPSLQFIAIVLLAMSCSSSAAVVESFTYNPEVGDRDQNKVLPFLWVQKGELEVRKAAAGTAGPAGAAAAAPATTSTLLQPAAGVGVSTVSATGTASDSSNNNMKLDRLHPVAETALLDWDAVSTSLNFSTCIYHDWCEAAPGNLSLMWSADAIDWQPLWNRTFQDLPQQRDVFGKACRWQEVSVPVPATAAAPRFAFKWVHADLGKRGSSSPCSVTLLDDITLALQAPTAANMAYGKAGPAPDVTAESCSACTTLCKTGVMGSAGGGWH